MIQMSMFCFVADLSSLMIQKKAARSTYPKAASKRDTDLQYKEKEKNMIQPQLLQEPTETKSDYLASMYVDNLADRYIWICKETKNTWSNFEHDCLVAAENTCLKSGSSTK